MEFYSLSAPDEIPDETLLLLNPKVLQVRRHIVSPITPRPQSVVGLVLPRQTLEDGHLSRL